jgi:two-component system, OmpR family, phosphate regulon sensor histidine kinase PhoR
MFKKSKNHLIILIVAFTCLISLTVIQISWILKAARMQEAMFTHSVTLAMNSIVENLAKEKAICKEVANCMREGSSGSCSMMMKNREEWANMGILIKKDLKSYGINLDFEFDIIESNSQKQENQVKSVYFSDDLASALKETGYELRIKFPEKHDFIQAQIGYIFVFSITLLLLISLSFLLIFSYYRKEKMLAGNIVDFVNNMTHEFKTPLTNISLANSMISKADAVETDKKLSFYTHVIKAEHNKLKHRIDELLKTSFSESGQPLYNEIIDLSSVVENVAETFLVQIKESDGNISIRKEGENFIVKGNIDLFQIAIGNIIDNSIKYCSDKPDINILLISGSDSIKLSITDNGIGIPKDKLDNIFEKYYRVPKGNVHDNDGFGLGLYHVKNIIKRMNGKIRVTSTLGRGSCFTIELPITYNND